MGAERLLTPGRMNDLVEVKSNLFRDKIQMLHLLLVQVYFTCYCICISSIYGNCFDVQIEGHFRVGVIANQSIYYGNNWKHLSRRHQ